jgi:glycosyltransferase involved in cell wall biosynthesis
MLLEAFAAQGDIPFVAVGNLENGDYARDLAARYGGNPNNHLIAPIYDLGVLATIRAGALVYVHGHSAGGTNPSLVEVMHFGCPVLAFDCAFNCYTTEGAALYFESAAELHDLLMQVPKADLTANGDAMQEIAQHRYTWAKVAQAYFDLLDEPA